MQYYTPHTNQFVGDCMPFYHDGVFHLYYLLDEEHHGGNEGLGGHQWAHASSRDLLSWQHHPLALPQTEPYEASICTGSVFFHDGLYHAFYATRLPDRREHLSLATSRDGIHFEKASDRFLLSPPPGYDPLHFRDPFVFQHEETGQFHMLVTAQRTGARFLNRGGCLAHFVSPDLRSGAWTEQEPFLEAGYLDRPECPDHFYWNGWYYLLFSIDSSTRYRMSRSPLGPWQRPPRDTLEGLMVHVMKTAPAPLGDRRLAAGYLASLRAPGQTGKLPYAGNAVFRELLQHEDGTLGLRFPPEMLPPAGEPLTLPFVPLNDGVQRDEEGAICIQPAHGFGAAALDHIPHNAHITLRVEPQPGLEYFGLTLRGRGAYESGHELRLAPHEQTATLRHPTDATYVVHEEHTLRQVTGLSQPHTLEIIMKDDIIDVCIDNRRTMANRVVERTGERLFLWGQGGAVRFGEVVVRGLG